MSDATTHETWRRVLAPVLVVLGLVLLLTGVLAVFGARLAFQPSFLSDRAGALLENPAIREAVSRYTVDETFSALGVRGDIRRVLPPAERGLVGPIDAAAQGGATRAVDDLLGLSAVIDLWQDAVKAAGEAAVAVVDDATSGSGLVGLRGDAVVLDLGDIADRLAGALGYGRVLSPTAGQVTLMTNADIPAVQTGIGLLRTLAPVLPPLGLVLLALAVWILPGRRRHVLVGIGAGLMVVGALLRVVLHVTGDRVVSALTATRPGLKPAGLAAWDILTDPVTTAAVHTLIIGGVLWLGALLVGPGRVETRARHAMAPVLRRRWAVYSVVGAAALGIVGTRPHLATERWASVLLLLVLAIVGAEALHRAVRGESLPAPAAAGA